MMLAGKLKKIDVLISKIEEEIHKICADVKHKSAIEIKPVKKSKIRKAIVAK